ncbi:hypothetical protein [Tunturiibacter psychrotolerans]|uniref:hypothetical protein n=1 Tax=Tunturiibacter psychrotolerans TaxID=3069686 RepID=UPI003D1FDE02
MTTCPELIHRWWNLHLPVGVVVACFGLVGVAVPWFRGEKTLFRHEKAIWTLLMFVLVGLEIDSIYQDQIQRDAEQRKAACEQANRFEGIAEKLEADISANRIHFDAMMTKDQGILDTARSVNQVAKANLDNITGGDSYGYVEPVSTRADYATVTLHNDGDQILTGVSVVIERVLNNCVMEADAKCIPEFDPGMMTPIEMGSLGSHQHKPIPREIDFDPARNGSGQYNVRIYAQNGQAIQQIFFRKSTMHRGYAYRYTIIRTVSGKPQKGDFKLGEEMMRTLKVKDWSEYSPSESLDGVHLYHRH